MICKHFRVVLLLSSLLLLAGCDKGLSPDPTGFSGVITFINWPPADSILELRLAAFKDPPTDTSGLFLEWVKGNVVIYPPVGTPAFRKFNESGQLVDSIRYTSVLQGVTTLEPVRYSYVALAWRYGKDPFKDWRPAGIYTLQPGSFTPALLTVFKHEFVAGIDIRCDFHNLPPRPWR